MIRSIRNVWLRRACVLVLAPLFAVCVLWLGVIIAVSHYAGLVLRFIREHAVAPLCCAWDGNGSSET